VQYLVGRGFVEIELLGQTVNHWREPPGSGRGDLDFANLLEAVATLPGVQRLRFVTSYPRDFTARMVEQVGTQEVICPYLHLPVQSGSDRVLRRMGRGYTRSEYVELVRRLREARPRLALSTDVIVGFPGESEDDFQRTLELVDEVRFASVYAFKYSPRPFTAAPRLDGAVPAEVADERLQRLFTVQEEIQRELNRALVGEEHTVLATGWGRQPGVQTGRTACHRVVLFDAGADPVPLGQLARVRIEKALPHSLLATRLAA
jgi:tRNA-2-methylthio-N6-dimethylallyladenosine synthase